MTNCSFIYGACIAGFALATAAVPAPASSVCTFDWAEVGRYQVSGNFRGQVETVVARLTHDCRIAIELPGVSTGGALRRVGNCLAFSLRVQGEQHTFEGRWCGSYGTVPWQGRNVRATIARLQDGSRTETR